MEYLPYIFAATLVILTIILSVVGIYMVLVLMQLRATLRKVNGTLDTVENKVEAIAAPLSNLGGAAVGMKTGMKMIELFIDWLHRDESGQKKTG